MSFPNKKVFSRLWLLAGALFAVPSVTYAHAFGQQYSLPIPVSFYITGGVCAFIASWAVLLLFSEPSKIDIVHTKKIVLGYTWGRGLNIVLKSAGLFLYFFILAVSFFGSGDYIHNPSVTFFWIIFLLGFTYTTMVVDGLWSKSNPFKTCVSWVLGSDYKPFYAYPKKLGFIPAILIFFGLLWFELLSDGLGSYPFFIGIVIVGYSFVCLAGSVLFGIESWFEQGEFFTVFFGTLGKFAPLRVTTTVIEVSKPAERLVSEHAPRLDLIIFILLILFSTFFDGVRDTSPWRHILYFFSPYGIYANSLGLVALFIGPFIFFGLYWLAIYLMREITDSKIPLVRLLLLFGYSLIPIAIAYHFAHYFNLLIGEGQRIIPQLSDPFGVGANYFGTRSYRPNLIPLGSDIVWYIQLLTIVVGHAIAAIVAHRIAKRVFDTKKHIILGQLPMLCLMVFYTALGLWILAQPFVPQ